MDKAESLIATWRERAAAWPSCERQWTGEDMKLAVETCANELQDILTAPPAEGGESITLAKIKEARAKITSPPWVVMTNGLHVSESTGIAIIEAYNRGTETPDPKANASFIANSPAYVDWLIAQLDASNARNLELLRANAVVVDQARIAARTPAPVAQTRLHSGELWIDEDGATNFKFHIEGGSFTDARWALEKFINCLRDRLGRSEECPFSERVLNHCVQCDKDFFYSYESSVCPSCFSAVGVATSEARPTFSGTIGPLIDRQDLLDWLAHRCNYAPVCGRCTYCHVALNVALQESPAITSEVRVSPSAAKRAAEKIVNGFSAYLVYHRVPGVQAPTIEAIAALIESELVSDQKEAEKE